MNAHVNVQACHYKQLSLITWWPPKTEMFNWIYFDLSLYTRSRIIFFPKSQIKTYKLNPKRINWCIFRRAGQIRPFIWVLGCKYCRCQAYKSWCPTVDAHLCSWAIDISDDDFSLLIPNYLVGNFTFVNETNNKYEYSMLNSSHIIEERKK